mgnify:CR=1 FL=1
METTVFLFLFLCYGCVIYIFYTYNKCKLYIFSLVILYGQHVNRMPEILMQRSVVIMVRYRLSDSQKTGRHLTSIFENMNTFAFSLFFLGIASCNPIPFGKMITDPEALEDVVWYNKRSPYGGKSFGKYNARKIAPVKFYGQRVSFKSLARPV